jgi:hypothetical protein
LRKRERKWSRNADAHMKKDHTQRKEHMIGATKENCIEAWCRRTRKESNLNKCGQRGANERNLNDTSNTSNNTGRSNSNLNYSSTSESVISMTSVSSMVQ